MKQSKNKAAALFALLLAALLSVAGCAAADQESADTWPGDAGAEHSAENTTESLTAMPVKEEYPGIVVEVNGEQYPMNCAGDYAYVYGYAEFQAGDRVVIVDNTNDTAYGHDDLAEEYQWNTYDYHRGEAGEFVIDRQGRYALAFSKGGNSQVYIKKAFAPSDGDGYEIVLRDEQAQRISMEEMAIAQAPGTLDAFLRFAAEQAVTDSPDTAAYIVEKGLHAYSAAVYLEAGTRFQIESTAASARITGDHLTEVFGASGHIRLSEEYIEITQAGTYHIWYLPSYGSISIELLCAESTDAAREFDKKTAAIPSYSELYYTDEIKQLYAQYLRLPESIRPLLRASAKLETMYGNVLTLESASSGAIYYMNTESTKQVYRSKDALFQAFFTDFYYYIAAYHGTERLKGYGINHVDDFLALAKNGDGNYGSGLNGIGYAAGKYFLEAQSNGILQTQTENSFLGFCCENGLYQDVLPFLIRFFAYWRIDEGYADRTNCGADMFAEGWAPTVDIAKFFYYDQQTSYVRSERMTDCFTNTAGVVYGFDSAEPLPEIRLRGYLFEGWYDNPEFSGEPVSRLVPTGEPVRLYAKWSVDTQLQDQDDAALVDVYIYNLTTQWAVRNPDTVGYVKKMYDGLTPNARMLVTQYPALQGFVERYLKS